jgi:hypothetical protein
VNAETQDPLPCLKPAVKIGLLAQAVAMGIGSYFKAAQPAPPPSMASARGTPSGSRQPGGLTPYTDDKQGSRTDSSNGVHELADRGYQSSRPGSVTTRSFRSGRTNGSSLFLDEIKHEVMVNYLYQQQCSHLWVADGSGEIEGVILRKARGQYMACPPQLVTTPFGAACAQLNVQVGIPSVLPIWWEPRSIIAC